ncbi:MAG: hypothetical protein ACYSUD_10330 [Planctomycetota bacterium]|jgi:hypothetical protein
MAVVVKDVVEGTTVQQGGRGTTATRIFHVSGITGDPSAKADLALRHPDVAALGERHPAYAELFCTNRSIGFIDSTNARVDCQYSIPSFERGDLPEGSSGSVAVPSEDTEGTGSTDLGTITVAATGAEFETDLDVMGNQMICAHVVKLPVPVTETSFDEFGDPIPRAESSKRVEQVQRARISIPQLVLRVQRMEKGSPDQKARDFVGTVNSKAIGIDGPRTWLCTRVDGTSNDGGDTYKVTYEFQYNKELWIFIGIWIDPTTDKPVPSKDFDGEGEEFKVFRVYDEADFSKLGIKFEGVVGGGRPGEVRPSGIGLRPKKTFERARTDDIEVTDGPLGDGLFT